MAVDVMNLIDQQFDRASSPRPSGKPTFLFFKNGWKARVRPLVNLNQVTVMKMHHKFSMDAESRVNAVCASEIGKTCKYCDLAPADKKLSPSISFMLPVYVYQVVDKFGNIITAKDENGEEQPIKGVRIIELTAYGTINAVLGIFRAYFKDEDSHDITKCDFVIEQSGEGQSKQFNTIPKSPSQFTVKLAQVTEERVRIRVIEACPPVVLQSAQPSTPSSASSSNGASDDDAPEF